VSDIQARLREIARRLLTEGHVRVFIGFGPGFEANRPVPFFAADPDAADRLLLDEFCAAGLARYVLEEVREGPVGLVARGCDGLGLERLLADHRVAREQLYVVGVSCRGVVDPDRACAAAGEEVRAARVNGETVTLITPTAERSFPRSACLLDKCLRCQDPTPRIADVLLGEAIPPGERDLAHVDAVERMPSDERYRFWARQFERCLRCLACRQVCPACNCVSCSLDRPEWLERGTGLAEQFMFHFTRAYHVAGRCVACGECERACPAGIPLGLLNDKFMKDLRDLFGVAAPHRPGDVEPLGKFCPDDPEGWHEGGEGT